MTNTNPLWKVLLLGGSLFIGVLFALPNVFGSDPAVQVSSSRGPLTPALTSTVRNALSGAGFSGLPMRTINCAVVMLFEK